MASNWREVCLAAVMDVKHGFAFPGENIRDEPPGDILLTPGNFSIGGGFKGDKFKYFDGDVPEDYVLREGELLVTMTDLSKQADTLGYPAIVPKPRGTRFLHNQRLGKVLIKEGAELDRGFLFYLLRTAKYRNEVLASATGTTVKHTSPSRILAYKANIPARAQQEAIASVLGALDDKIELSQQMNATLEALARALFQSWFVDFDPVRAKLDGLRPAGMDAVTGSLFPSAFESSQFGPIPAGWAHTTLAEVCSKITDGAHQSPKSVDAGLPMASVKDMTDWEINIPSCRHISEMDFQGLVANGCQPELGDILLAKDGATCLNTACEYQQKEAIVLLSSVAILRPKQSYNSAFLHTWLGLSSTKTYLKENFVSGSAIPRVVLRDMKRARLISPPPKILDAFSRAVAPLREKIRHNIHQSRTLATLRDTLLPKLLSGELDVSKLSKAA